MIVVAQTTIDKPSPDGVRSVAELSGRAGHDQHLGLALEGETLRRDQLDGIGRMVGHDLPYAVVFIFSAASTTSSIAPTR